MSSTESLFFPPDWFQCRLWLMFMPKFCFVFVFVWGISSPYPTARLQLSQGNWHKRRLRAAQEKKCSQKEPWSVISNKRMTWNGSVDCQFIIRGVRLRVCGIEQKAGGKATSEEECKANPHYLQTANSITGSYVKTEGNRIPSVPAVSGRSHPAILPPPLSLCLFLSLAFSLAPLSWQIRISKQRRCYYTGWGCHNARSVVSTLTLIFVSVSVSVNQICAIFRPSHT